MSDTAARAMQDCKKWSNEKKYMLLCQVRRFSSVVMFESRALNEQHHEIVSLSAQVALGHVKEIRGGSSASSDAEVANSIMTAGKMIPTPGKELILPEGECCASAAGYWKV